MTILFSDIVGSTKLKQILGDRGAIDVIQRHHAVFREILSRFDLTDGAIDLATVAVAFDGEVHQVQAFLARMRDVGGQKNNARAGAENRLRLAELSQRSEHFEAMQQIQHGGALATGEHEAVDFVELLGSPDEDRIGSGTG